MIKKQTVEGRNKFEAKKLEEKQGGVRKEPEKNKDAIERN